MKKTFLTGVLILSGLAITLAQEPLKNKNGIIITPEPKEFGLSIDAVPVLRYAGSLFNDSNEEPSAQFGANNPLTLSGLYVARENFAYRAKVRIGISSEKQDTLVARAGSTNPNETVANSTRTTETNFTIGGGMQWWRGKARVKGYYGGELLFNINTAKTNYEYGNALSSENQATRIKSEKPGNSFGFHLRGFVGVEYFFAAKMSVSAEFGWGPALVSTGQGELQEESWNGSGVDVRVANTGKSSAFNWDNDNANGAINLNFYF